MRNSLIKFIDTRTLHLYVVLLLSLSLSACVWGPILYSIATYAVSRIFHCNLCQCTNNL